MINEQTVIRLGLDKFKAEICAQPKVVWKGSSYSGVETLNKISLWALFQGVLVSVLGANKNPEDKNSFLECVDISNRIIIKFTNQIKDRIVFCVNEESKRQDILQKERIASVTDAIISGGKIAEVDYEIVEDVLAECVRRLKVNRLPEPPAKTEFPVIDDTPKNEDEKEYQAIFPELSRSKVISFGPLGRIYRRYREHQTAPENIYRIVRWVVERLQYSTVSRVAEMTNSQTMVVAANIAADKMDSLLLRVDRDFGGIFSPINNKEKAALAGCLSRISLAFRLTWGSHGQWLEK